MEAEKTDILIIELNSLSKAIIKTLLYFDIFQHPLSTNEIHCYCQEYLILEKDIQEELDRLMGSGFIKYKDDFYYINQNDSIIERRKSGNLLAKKYFKTAIKYSEIIASFPFVEGVYLSGSIAKGYMDKQTDIDYFIITKPNRLWLSRTILILFKKIFLFNSHKYFCLNYFIGSNNLEIPDKNIFTATEIIAIIPMYNERLYADFINANIWTQKYYPNLPKAPDHRAIQERKRPVKRSLEYLFSSKIGEYLDMFCLKLTLKYRKKKFNYMDEKQFDLNIRSHKNTSKHHPNGFQEKILQQHRIKIEEFERTNNLILS